MKRIVLILFAVILAVPAAALAGVISPARIVLTEGDVLFRTPDADEWMMVSINTPLDEGDVLWTPAGSRTEVQLADGTIVRLNGDTELDLIAVEEDFTHLHLAQGGLYIRTTVTSGNNSLQIDADDTTIIPDARTRLRIDMLPNNQEDISIFKGSAYVEGNGSRTKVRAGDHIALEEGHSELLQLNPPDSWERWNNDRDRSQLRTTTAESYLPDELRPFSSELDSTGRWVRVPEYGMVWRPAVIASDNWAPYRSGRWVWKGDDYVWISYEAWGWAPYHYGRWAVLSGFGWCWVPPARGDIYWGPGYVGWFKSGNHVGWTPLAPGETFYGRKNYGRHSIISTNGSVRSAAVNYKNRSARGGFSVLLQNDFLRGRSAFQQPSNSVALSMSASLGSPRIRPIRETRMPNIKQTPPRVAPPVPRRQDSRELRARFPRVTPNSERHQRTQPSVGTLPPAPLPAATPRPSGQPTLQRNETIRTRPTPSQDSVKPRERTEQRPITGPAERQVAPQSSTRQGGTPGQTQQSDTNRTRSAPPRDSRPVPERIEQMPVPVPPVKQASPPTTPQRSDISGQPRRTDTNRTRSAPPGDTESIPERTKLSPDPIPPVMQAPPQTVPRHGDTPGQIDRGKPRDLNQKKVWKVITTEQDNSKEPRGKDTSREQRGR